MKLFGYSATESNTENVVPSELAEIALVASPTELRTIAGFLQAAAEGMDRGGTDWEHEHLSDKHKEFKVSPHFVVFNPNVG
jgi:hypothetical protein